MEEQLTSPAVQQRVAEVEENAQVLGALLVLHGAVHLLGAALCWQIREFGNFTYDDVWPEPGSVGGWIAGAVWLFTAVAIGTVGVRMAAGRYVSRRTLAAVLVLSVAVTSTALPDALPGTIVSLVILASMGALAVRRRAAH